MSNTSVDRPSNCDPDEKERKFTWPFSSLSHGGESDQVNFLSFSSRTHFQGQSTGGEFGKSKYMSAHSYRYSE